jgi:hypothetical protein
MVQNGKKNLQKAARMERAGKRHGGSVDSLNKFRQKYAQALSTPFIIHTKDLKVEDGIVYLPLYMTPLL